MLQAGCCMINHHMEPGRAGALFPTTQWTLVLSAGSDRDPQSHGALASLCSAYWYPVYAYVRRRGFSVEDSQDLAQEFFARVLEKHYIERADRAKGRFRSFLLSCLTYFLCDEADRRHSLKRGGGQPLLPFEIPDAEELYQREPSHNETPERVYERRWALALLDRVLSRLRDDFAQNARLGHFDRLKEFLLDGEVPYSALTAELHMTEGSLRVALHRLRRRYRELFRAEIADTVASTDEIDSEIRHLLDALG
jgi:DNA-directed RNA polymerase specialized sigma24 family protein